MRIRITAVTSIADGAGNRYRGGQVADVDDDLAAAWIAAGHAEPADTEPADETEPAAGGTRGDKRTATRRAPRSARKKTADPPPAD